MAAVEQKYAFLNDNSERDSEIGIESPPYNCFSSLFYVYKNRYPWRILLLNLGLLFLSLLIIAADIVKYHIPKSGYVTNRNLELKEVSGFSPILDHITIPLATRDYNNTLFARTIYTSPPSPAVDAAWEALSPVTFSTITSGDVRRIGKDPSLTVHLPHNPDAHIILPTVVHQIHCLDSIRKMVFHDHYFLHGSNSPLHWDHLQHCIGLVLDGLRCASSVDPIVMNWMQDQEGPVLDFDISMKCRDHDAFLREWEAAHSLDADEVGALRRVGGEVDVPAPPPFTKLVQEGAFEEAARKDEELRAKLKADKEQHP